MNDNHYITYTIESWMTEEYGLKGNELLLYALIYNFSKFGGQQAWYGSLSMIEKITGMTKRTAMNAYKSLEQKGMIKKEEVYINNVKTCKYTAVLNKKNSHFADGNGSNNTEQEFTEHNIPYNDGEVKQKLNDSLEKVETELNQSLTDDRFANGYYDSMCDEYSKHQIQEVLFDEPVKEEPKKKSKPKKTYEPEIKEVIDFLNSKTNRGFKPDTEQTVINLNRWFKKGYKVEDIKQMISFKVNQWKGTDNEQWLIPSTLFRKSNFEGYVEASQGYQDFISDAERGCINV